MGCPRTELRKVTFTVALADVNRQVCGCSGEGRVLAIGRCAQRAASLVQHVACTGFCAQAHARRHDPCILCRMGVNPVRGFPQQVRSDMQTGIYLAKRSLRNKQRHGLEDYELVRTTLSVRQIISRHLERKNVVILVIFDQLNLVGLKQSNL